MKNTLLFTHSDLDGCGCAILIKQVFPQTHIVNGTYIDIDKKFEDNYSPQYRNIFITDISLNEDNLQKTLTSNVVPIHFIDHHPREKKSIIKKQLHNEKYSATALTLRYIIDNFNYIPTKEILLLVRYINDYDLWKKQYKMSKMLNRLYYYYGFNKFLERFSNGLIGLNDIEKDFLVRNQNFLNKLFKETEVTIINNHVIFLITDRETDELADYHFNNNSNLHTIFLLNPKNNNCSIRGKGQEQHLGNFCKKHGGGGHKDAAAIRVPDIEFLEKVINNYITTS